MSAPKNGIFLLWNYAIDLFEINDFDYDLSPTWRQTTAPTIVLIATKQNIRVHTYSLLIQYQRERLGQFVIYYDHQALEIDQVLPYLVDFKAPGEIWNLLNEAVLSKCSFI